MKDIPATRTIGKNKYSFGGAYWYIKDAIAASNRTERDIRGRPFMITRIFEYDSRKWRLPLNLGEVSPETSRMGGEYSRSTVLTGKIFALYYRPSAASMKG